MATVERLRLGRFDDHGTTRTRFDGQIIEVEHGIPEEVVDVRLEGTKRRWGHIQGVVEAAPDRVEPLCEYFRDWSCGGCQWQMIEYRGQLHRKREAVEATMQRRGVDLQVSAIHALDDPWRYRSTAGISLGKRAGFRRRASLAIVPIRDCPISHPLIGRLMADLNDALDAGSLPDFRGRLRLDVLVTGPSEQPALQVLARPTEESGGPAEGDVRTLVGYLTELPYIDGVSLPGSEGTVEIVSGDAFALTSVHGKSVALSAGSFFQTNLFLLPRLIDRLRQEAQPLSGKRLADVYGGTGLFGLFLAEEAGEVVVIESDRAAVEAGEKTAALWGVENIRFVTERAETALIQEEGVDIVIVDPPRSGLSRGVLETLAETCPSTILYVSCLADSLGRDLNILARLGYSVESLELFDFYPQTYHVELLAVLRA